MFYAKIGSISTGTLLPVALAATYTYELAQLARRDDQDERKQQVLATLVAVQPFIDAEDGDQMATFVHETAPELFNGYCAPYTYFGSHAGDGADIGFWPDIDSVQEAARYHDGVVGVEAGDAWPELDENIDYVVEVNDHGNVSLYDARTKAELWACV